MKYKANVSRDDLRILANQVGHALTHYALDTEPQNGKAENVFEIVGLYFDDKNIEIHCEEGTLPPNDFDIGVFSIKDWGTNVIPSGTDRKLFKIPIQKELVKVELLQEHVIATNSTHKDEWELEHTVGFILSFKENKFTVNKHNSWSDFLTTNWGNLDLSLPQNNEWNDAEENGIKYHYAAQLMQIDISDYLKA